ncbi:MAG TPA: enoyl-CoA hydratase-related protein, partial [Ilumatobacter sp.]|nr:enoyl-CoA hydratase-related protein [Ilumatobacter sp.]
MDRQYVDVSVDGPVTTITLNNPAKRNSLALDVMLELTDVLREVGDSDALGVILAAEGPVFSAGHNFGDMVDVELPDAQHLLHVCTDMMNMVQHIPQVVIAKVAKLATAAGCQLVATCDMAIAAESAGFALPGGKGGLFCNTPLVA